jgi:hypothetical protein
MSRAESAAFFCGESALTPYVDSRAVFFGVAVMFSGVAFVVGALCAAHWSPPDVDISGFYAAGIGMILLGLVAVLADRRPGRLRWSDGTLVDDMASKADPVGPDDVAPLVYELADKALAGQVSEMQALRAANVALIAIGPATAAVIVATTGSKFDMLALLALLLFTVAILTSFSLLVPVRGFSAGVVLEDELPAGARLTALQHALAERVNWTRARNGPILRRSQARFLLAASGFLAAVLIWTIHAATHSHWLFAVG